MQGSSTGNGRAVQRFPNTLASATDMSFQNRNGWCARSKGLSGLGAVTSFFLFFFFRLRDQCDSRIYTWGKNGMNHRVFLNRKGCYIAMQFRKDSAEKLLQFHFAMEFDNWWQLQQLFTDDIYPNLSTDDNWWIAWARSKLCVCDTEVACPERRWAMGRPVAMGSEINEGRRPNPWLCWSKVWGIFSNLLDLLDILLTPAGFHLW